MWLRWICITLFLLQIIPVQAQFSVQQKDGKLTILEKNQPVLVYNFETVHNENAPERMARSSYIHPLYSVDGTIITDDFPRDHYHHRGVYWTWNRVFWKDRQLDPWAVRGLKTEFESWLSRETSNEQAKFGVRNGWITDDGIRIVDELVYVTVHPAQEKTRAIDFHIELWATDEDVTLKGEITKGYGGFSVRLAPKEKEVICSPEGVHTDDELKTSFPWCDYAFVPKGKEEFTGVAVFVSPTHPGYPPDWLLRHYGYFGVCYPGMESVTLKKGTGPLIMDYRIWTHPGTYEDVDIQQAYDEYVQSVKRQGK
ncbi:MAG: DUF6807 family protein [bacterium]|jgi:hypothetical protein